MDLVTFSTPVPTADWPDVAKRLYYYAEGLHSFEPVHSEDRTMVVGVWMSLDESVSLEAIAEEINASLIPHILALRHEGTRQVWSRQRTSPERTGLDAELLARGWIAIHGEGQVSLAPPLVELFNALDRLFQDISRRRFGAREYRYPVLLSSKVLSKAGYFKKFPNLLFSVSRMRSDIGNYRRFEAFAKCAHGDGQFA